MFDEDKTYRFQDHGVILCGWDEYWTEEWVEDEEWENGGYWSHDVVLSDTFMQIKYRGDDRIFTVDIADLEEYDYDN